MEAMHSTDFLFFRRSSPSPTPVIRPPTEKEIEVSIDEVSRDFVSVTAEKKVEESKHLKVLANEERTRGIQDVRP